MFPHFIESKFIDSTVFGCQTQAVLWQLDHYSYQIDITGHEGYINMPDTPFEEAMEVFNQVK